MGMASRPTRLVSQDMLCDSAAGVCKGLHNACPWPQVNAPENPHLRTPMMAMHAIAEQAATMCVPPTTWRARALPLRQCNALAPVLRGVQFPQHLPAQVIAALACQAWLVCWYAVVAYWMQTSTCAAQDDCHHGVGAGWPPPPSGFFYLAQGGWWSWYQSKKPSLKVCFASK